MDVDDISYIEEKSISTTCKHEPTGVIHAENGHFLILAPACLPYMLSDPLIIHEAPQMLDTFHKQLSSLPSVVKTLCIDVSTLHTPTHGDFCRNVCESDQHTLVDDDMLVEHVLSRLPTGWIGILNIVELLSTSGRPDGGPIYPYWLGQRFARNVPQSICEIQCGIPFGSESIDNMPRNIRDISIWDSSRRTPLYDSGQWSKIPNDTHLMTRIGHRFYGLRHLSLFNVNWDLLLTHPLEKAFPNLLSIKIKTGQCFDDTHLSRPRMLLNLPSCLRHIDSVGVVLKKVYDKNGCLSNDPLQDFEHWTSFLPRELHSLDVICDNGIMDRTDKEPIGMFSIPSVWTSLPPYLVSISLRINWRCCNLQPLLYDTCKSLRRVKMGISFKDVPRSTIPSYKDVVTLFVFGHTTSNIQPKNGTLVDFKPFPASKLEHIILVLEDLSSYDPLLQFKQTTDLKNVSPRELELPYAISPLLNHVSIYDDWEECDNREENGPEAEHNRSYLKLIGRVQYDSTHTALMTFVGF